MEDNMSEPYYYSVSSDSVIYDDSLLFTTPELVDYIVTDDTIELVFKRFYRLVTGVHPSPPQVFKDVYSRRDGSVTRVFGNYVPPKSESYEFGI